jgi:hypothetical protein
MQRAILHPSILLAAVRQKTLDWKSGIFAVTWYRSPRNHIRNLRNKKVRNSLLPMTPWGFRGAPSGSGEELTGFGRAMSWLRRSTVTSAPGQNLPLLAPNSSYPFWLQTVSASCNSVQDLPLLAQEKICFFWFRTRPSSTG